MYSKTGSGNTPQVSGNQENRSSGIVQTFSWFEQQMREGQETEKILNQDDKAHFDLITKLPNPKRCFEEVYWSSLVLRLPLNFLSERKRNIEDFNILYKQTPTWNQSMVQQLIRDGNCRRRFRKASPIGLKATTMWRFSLQRVTKNAKRAKGLNSKFLFPPWAMGHIVWGREI